MKIWLTILLIATISITGCTRPAAAPAVVPQPVNPALFWTFDTDAEGSLPAGAVVYSGNWTVRSEHGSPSSPNAFCQTGSGTFPAVVLSGNTYADVTVQTSFRPVSGVTDRAAGIIFHIQDVKNYYILRANALENNVNIYKYVNGSRITLKEGSAPVVSGKWQVLRVEVNGADIRGFLDGKLVVEANDTTFTSGKIGLWTKADSIACFDNVEVK